jgi:predicted nucleic acid-binding protein
VREENSDATRCFLEEQTELAVWWATSVECVSALARKEREGRLSLAEMTIAQKNLNGIMENSLCVGATESVRRLAQKLLRRYPLRAADSLQLAAACFLAGESTEDYGFVCNDERLTLAAAKEGFIIRSFQSEIDQNE